MCRTSSAASGEEPQRENDGAQTAFPWHLGAYDAHCHPTDTMASIADIGAMHARLLTVMATRAQDQDLVASVASTHGITNTPSLQHTNGDQASKARVVPSFGWHPWFSYQLEDDLEATPEQMLPDSQERKRHHYNAVLSPSPVADNFLNALPQPRSLSGFLHETKMRLQEHPLALVGEIGLDKAFRLPEATASSESELGGEILTPGGREGRSLSLYHVKLEHQIKVLTAQLKLAGEMGRAVSVHGVQAHGVVHSTLASTWKGFEREVLSNSQRKRIARNADNLSSSEESEGEDTRAASQPKPPKIKPFPPRICLHSFSAPAPMVKQYLNPAIPAKIFFSFSTAVNLGGAGGEKGEKSEAKFAEVVRAIPDDQILVESDLHVAGERMDRMLEDMYRKICAVKGWDLEEGVTKIGTNYQAFIFGDGERGSG